MRHLKKELLTNSIKFNGKIIAFEAIGQNNGVIALDESQDAALIAELDRLADARKMGVVRISAEIYDSLKKKARSILSRPPQGVFGGKLRVFDNTKTLVQNKPSESFAATAAIEPAAPPIPEGPVHIPPPKSKFVARMARLSQLRKETPEPEIRL